VTRERDGMSKSMRIECSAILFDLDGVLVDSTAYVERQWREWAASRGLDPAPFVRYCHGRRAVETIRLAAPELDADAEVARFYANARPDDVHLDAFPGARDLLLSLPAGTWAVVTSTVRESALRRISEAGLPEPQVLVSAEQVRAGKPSPEGYLGAAALLGVAPAACVVIEDAPPGIEAGRAAGMPVVALRTTYPTADLAGATAIADALAALRIEPVPGPGPSRLRVVVPPPARSAASGTARARV
jgi:sugar-phosphatase